MRPWLNCQYSHETYTQRFVVGSASVWSNVVPSDVSAHHLCQTRGSRPWRNQSSPDIRCRVCDSSLQYGLPWVTACIPLVTHCGANVIVIWCKLTSLGCSNFYIYAAKVVCAVVNYKILWTYVIQYFLEIIDIVIFSHFWQNARSSCHILHIRTIYDHRPFLDFMWY